MSSRAGGTSPTAAGQAQRLFVAVWPPGAVHDELTRRRSAVLDGPWAPLVRWTAPTQWHMTLRFLGRAHAAEVVAALDATLLPAAAAVVRPGVHRLGRDVISVPVDGLDELAAAVVRATAALGRPPEARPFRGHITLARRRVGAALRVPAGVAALGEEQRFTVAQISLVASRTEAAGARYEVLARWPTATG